MNEEFEDTLVRQLHGRAEYLRNTGQDPKSARLLEQAVAVIETKFKPTHQHYKGGKYRVRVIRDADNWNGPPLPDLLGWTLYENEQGDLICRRSSEFHENVSVGNEIQPRFKPL